MKRCDCEGKMDIINKIKGKLGIKDFPFVSFVYSKLLLKIF